MSMSLQKKVMDHLEKITKKSNLDFVEQEDSPHSGTVFIQDGFKTVLSFCYHFNQSNVDIQWYPSGVITKRSPGFIKDSRCILNVNSDINSLPQAIEICEKLIESFSVPSKTEAKTNQQLES